MFKSNSFKILKEKKIQIEKSEAEKFYKVHETKPFYNDLCDYLSSGPIVVMVLEKENAVLGDRELMGSTTAAQFLQRFILNKTPWAHLDIAGMAFSKYGGALNSGGATGYGVRLLNKLIEDNYE